MIKQCLISIFQHLFAKIKRESRKKEKDKPFVVTQIKKYEFHKVLDTNRIEFVEDPMYDGVIFIRENVPDLDLGGKHYAQIRLLTSENTLIKGMAMFSIDIPDGKDVVVHYNAKYKTQTIVPITEESSIKVELLNDGIGSCIYDMERKIDYDWDEWRNNLPTQFLSKEISEAMTTIKVIKEE